MINKRVIVMDDYIIVQKETCKNCIKPPFVYRDQLYGEIEIDCLTGNLTFDVR